MNIRHHTPAAPTPTPTSPPAPPRNPVAPAHRLARRVLRVLAYGLLTGAATTAGKAAMDLAITLIHHH